MDVSACHIDTDRQCFLMIFKLLIHIVLSPDAFDVPEGWKMLGKNVRINSVG